MADNPPAPTALTWKDVLTRLRDEPIDTVVQVAVAEIEHPLNAGLASMPASAADRRPVFGTVVDEQTGYLVHDCGECYQARLYRFPQMPPALARQSAVVPVETRTELVARRRAEPFSLARLPAEEPGLTLLLTTLLGTAIGAAVGGSKGALAGGLVGLGSGMASVAVSTAATSPATALTAQTLFLGLAAAGLGGQAGGRVLRLAPMKQPALPRHRDEDGPPPQTRVRHIPRHRDEDGPPPQTRVRHISRKK